MCGGGGQPMAVGPTAAELANQVAQAKAVTDADAAKSAPYQKKKAQSLLSAYNPTAGDSGTTTTNGSTGKTTLGA